MDLEQACVVLGIAYETAEDFCFEVGANPHAIGPADLMSMAALRDESDEDDELDDDELDEFDEDE